MSQEESSSTFRERSLGLHLKPPNTEIRRTSRSCGEVVQTAPQDPKNTAVDEVFI